MASAEMTAFEVMCFMEVIGKALPDGWEAKGWDDWFPRLAELFATNQASLSQAEKAAILSVGAMANRRMTERYEAMSLTEIVIERSRNGGGE